MGNQNRLLSAVAVALVLTVMALLPAWCADTWYADGSVMASGDGTSWETGFRSIQEGIDAASDGDTVIVAEGTYGENVEFKGKNIVLRSTDPGNPTVVEMTIIDGANRGSVVTFAGTEDETCVLSGFTIQNGKAERGGGVCGGTSAGPLTRATIRNNVITENLATHSGGGLRFCNGLIDENTVAGNRADYHGGGLDQCYGVIQNNRIMDNSAGAEGGGLRQCSGAIRNNLIAGNSGLYGGGLCRCSGEIDSNTIYGNSANYGGGLYGCQKIIQGCIVWGNAAPNGPQLYNSSSPTYCCIQGWTEGGEGNLNVHPRFRDVPAGDHSLLANSPCIDVGKNVDWMQGAVDLDSNPRILIGALSLTVDIGAYEHSFPMAIARTSATEVELSWTMRPLRTYRVLSTFDPITTQPWFEETTIAGGESGGPAAWVDVDAMSTLKFYRIEIE